MAAASRGRQDRPFRVITLIIIALMQGLLLGVYVPVVVAPSSSSWNTKVQCPATVAGVRDVLGSSYPSQSLTGSQYQTSSTTGGVPNKRALSPPCNLTNTSGQIISSLVQINNVYLTNLKSEDCTSSYNSVNGGGSYPGGKTYCDATGNIYQIGTSSGYIHIEIDHDWQAAGYCGPGTVCDNSALAQQVSSGSISLDVQGLVYWDVGHWELHPFTAWKLSSSSTPLSAGFTYSPSNPTAGGSVSFTATATGGEPPYTFSWNFGDGSTGSGSSATHTYSSQGTYTVSLTVRDSASPTANTQTVTQSLTVNPPAPPGKYTLSWQGFDWDGGGEHSIALNGQILASLPTSDTSANANVYTPFSLDITSSVVQGTNRLLFTHANWDCSVVDSVKNLQVANGPTLVYSNSTVLPLSCTQSITYTFTIGGPPPLAASFTYSPANPSVNNTVNFTATVSGGTSPYSYSWRFGDGGSGSTNPASHAYSNGGAYMVILNVTDASTKFVIASQTVNVATPQLMASFGANPNPGTVGGSITFTASVSGGTTPYVYNWNFGDGATGTGNPAAHSYNSPGNYTVNLIVADSDGKMASSAIVVSIRPSSLATDFTFTPSNPIVGQTVNFTATISGGVAPYSYSWDFGDAGSANGSIVGHAYSTNGSYIVRLTVQDSLSQSASTYKTVTVGRQASPLPYALIISGTGQVFRYQNGTFTLIGQPVTTTLRQEAWRPDGSYALIVGDAGVLIKYDGTQLTPIVTGVTANLYALAWKPDGSYALIAGSGGILFKYNGTLTRISNPFSVSVWSISWNPQGSQALMVGSSGGILFYQSTGQITQAASGTKNTLYSSSWDPAGQYALIAGINDTILRYDGATSGVRAFNLTGLNISPSVIVRAISWSPDSSFALLVGDVGLALTYNGTTLARLTSPVGSNFYSIGWLGATAYIAGGSGSSMTYTSGVMTKIANNTGTSLRGWAWKPS